jgi:hypothetical protein
LTLDDHAETQHQPLIIWCLLVVAVVETSLVALRRRVRAAVVAQAVI